MNNLSNAARKRFISDFNLPIQLFEGEYFEYFVNLYDDLFNIKKKIELLNDCISLCNEHGVSTIKSTDHFHDTERNFFRLCEDKQNEIIREVLDLKTYRHFTCDSMEKYNVSNEYSLCKDNIYQPINNNETFVSFDLVKANFQALSYAIPEINYFSNNYRKFLQSFIKDEYVLRYFYNSKKIRQIIFGKLHPKRQRTVERFLIRKVLDFLVENKIFSKTNIYTVLDDEIIFKANDIPNDISNEVYKQTGVLVKGEMFELSYHEDPVPFYVKHKRNGSIEFKHVPVVYFAQAFKSFYKLETTPYDYRFRYEDHIAQFIN